MPASLPQTSRRRAFTLVEILVVVALLAFLLGISISALKSRGRTNRLTAKALEVKALATRARQTALTRHAPVELRFDLRDRSVAAHLRHSITYFHFDPWVIDEDEAALAAGAPLPDDGDTVVGSDGVIGTLEGNAGIHLEGEVGSGLAVGIGGRVGRVSIPYRTEFAMNAGLAVAADIYIDPPVGLPPEVMTIAHRSGVFDFSIDETGALAAEVTFFGTMQHLGQAVTGNIEVHSISDTVPWFRWVHVEMIADARGVRIYQDNVLQVAVRVGEESGVNPDDVLFGPPPQDDDPAAQPGLTPGTTAQPVPIDINAFRLGAGGSTREPILIGDGRGAFMGRLDNVEFSRVTISEPVGLPEDVVFGFADTTLIGAAGGGADPFAAGGGGFPETYNRADESVWVYFAADGFLEPAFHTRPVTLFLVNQEGFRHRLVIELTGTVR